MTSIRTEGLAILDGTEYYVIPEVDRLESFLVAVVSPDDHWLYASSSGGLAAGRVDAEGSLFPYRTDDLLHQVHGFSGGFTAIREGDEIWEPFTGRPGRDTTRDLARSTAGDRLLLSEVHHRLGLRATACWCFSDRSGILRRVSIERLDDGREDRRLVVLDGVRDLVPGGAGVGVMQSMSCLVHAYARAELVGEHGLATMAMESALSDRAEPAESLHATVVWGTGLPGADVLLDAGAAEAFLRGRDVAPRSRVVGRPTAHLRRTEVTIEPAGRLGWSLAADVRCTQAMVAAIRERLAAARDLESELDQEVAETSRRMDAITSATDGLQRSGDPIVDAHHRTNTLYNDMRGGIPQDRDRCPWGDWVAFVESRNRTVAARHREWLDARPASDTVTASNLVADAAACGDPDLERLSLEYLPFWFGRRHGDPSRPWNRFSIRIRDTEGRRTLAYEGNWRDIFQNWEALALAHPAWLEHFVAKFVNATTPDGFNAYRLTRDGIDWEVPEPDNPWSNLGYWGDHQIVYLTRLLEASRDASPERLASWIDRPIFSFADVPYRLAPHDRLVEDPRRSITFDHAAHDAAMDRVAATGADGRLVHDDAGVVHATLSEKLLVPVLAKLGSFVPDGGVWMNTQRPEWNDANNALAGYGLSMVTACQLRRHLAVVRDLHASGDGSIRWSAPSATWLAETHRVLESARPALADPTLDDATRRRVMDDLGRVFESRRSQSPARPSVDLDRAAIIAFCDVATAWLDHAIAANRREDGLFHSYNLLQTAAGTASIRRLPEMLEGQVAVLSAGVLSPGESADLLDALFTSALHRADLDTFLLQPVREIPALLDKGVVPADATANITIFERLVDAGDRTLVERDAAGVVRFAAGLVNGRDVAAVLDRLAIRSDLADVVAAERDAILALYENVFDHHAFTGRSGGMYGYEGIGCTYWHMVAKLLVAVGECVIAAENTDTDEATRARLVEHYHRVRNGLGFRMDAARFGGLPIDAYSHSDPDGRAKQPGMTGQVKEELLTRRMELGVRIERGTIRFTPTLLPESEWTTAPLDWSLPDGDGPKTIAIPADGLGFQFVGVPVVLHRVDGPARIVLHHTDGTSREIAGDRLDAVLSRGLLSRDHGWSHLVVDVPRS